MSEIRLGIAGMGTVGVGVVKLIADNQADLLSRGGSSMRAVAYSARSSDKDRGVDLSALDFEADPVALAMRDDVDVFVELIGGEEGSALASVSAALKAGKVVVTANKALVAVHGQMLADLVQAHGGKLYYEAAVAGGIPAIKMVREGLAANQINSVYGILNGTCNYILTEMEQRELGFDTVLKEAQELGYAEAEPSVDVDGWDAAHKLAILASLCFGGAPSMDALHVSGIRQVTLSHIKMAKELGFKIKLLGVARAGAAPTVAACAVPIDSSIASVDGSFNAVVVNGSPVDEVMIRGRGAGEGPTASAVVADILDHARGISPPLFGQQSAGGNAQASSSGQSTLRRMIAVQVRDEAGVIANLSELLSSNGLSVESMIQHSDGGAASLMIVTHPCLLGAVANAIQAIQRQDYLIGQPLALRVLSGE